MAGPVLAVRGVSYYDISCGDPPVSQKARTQRPRHPHAYEHALLQLDYDPDEHPPRFALVGPDTAGNLIELVAFLADDQRIIVIHALKARPHFLALLQDQENPS